MVLLSLEKNHSEKKKGIVFHGDAYVQCLNLGMADKNRDSKVLICLV